MQDLPLPGTLGRICTRECEEACRRCEVEEPIAIRALKRLAADQVDPGEIDIQCDQQRDEKVAIVGSGPAGLSAAYHLARKGIKSTIFESSDRPGGMLRLGIPEHRLPRHILEREIEVIKNLGVEVQTNSALGREFQINDLFQQGYNAIFLALGAHKGLNMGISGEESQGVEQGVEFLRQVNLGQNTRVGKKVAIIGGGNVAVDAARTATRLGAEEVNIIYRRTREEMPALPEEVDAALEEEINIIYLAAPREVLSKNGRVSGIRCIRMQLGEPDSSGRRKPIPQDGTEFDLEVDQIIQAIGQRPDKSKLKEVEGLEFTDKGNLRADPDTLETQTKGVFAGGDAQTGPWIAIGAVAAGKQAAESIYCYLDCKKIPVKKETPEPRENPDHCPIPEDITPNSRCHIPEKDLELRKTTFEEVELSLSPEKGQNEAERCLNCGYCCECRLCEINCLAGAIDHSDMAREIDLDVGSVILSSGGKAYDSPLLEEMYKHKSHPNVITSLEFERILSSSGPTMGHLERPSDQKQPQKIAWVQCVGSRDKHRFGNEYCSSVCCMYAIKEALIAKEHQEEGIDCAIFNMDIRCFGKDYERYYLRARDEEGVRFINSRVHSLIPTSGSENLLLHYVDDKGNPKQEEFDIVVLSVGLTATDEAAEMADKLGVELDRDNFIQTQPFSSVSTAKPGVYVCGTSQGPKDIPTSVAEASAAANCASSELAPARNTATKEIQLPPEIDISEQDTRIGVFVCNCGANIGGVVNVDEVVRFCESLPNVAFVTQNLFTCSEDAQLGIKNAILEHDLNRIVVASCTPKTHESIFMETLESCGLNKYLFEMANIRNQDSWVHSDHPDQATQKAKDLVRMAVARAANLYPLTEKKIPVNPRAMVIGGGISGMNSALGIAKQGFEVYLVEKEADLGGLSASLTTTIEGHEVREYVEDLKTQVTQDPNIQILTNSLIVGFTGVKGNFTTELLIGPGMYERKIEHGAIVLATGANEYTPTEYLYGQDDRVLTQTELAGYLQENEAKGLQDVVMIQCIGSRNEENPNCSRVCCQAAIKNALHIKELSPETNVYILYRDIRTYGKLEEYYTLAREKGVLFLRFSPEQPPEIESTPDGLNISLQEQIINRPIQINADLLCLSAGMVPEDTAELSSILKLQKNADGYFLEAHVKLRPMDMVTEGVFVCGTAHSPMLISEAATQARAAASRVSTFLAQSNLTLSAVTARVDPEKCAACLVCVRACPFGVPRINQDGVSEIDEALCQGCGVCAAECPAKAIELNWYEDKQITCEIDALLEGELG